MKIIRYRDDDKIKYWTMLTSSEFALINLALSIAIDKEEIKNTRENMEKLLYTNITNVNFEQVKPIDY